MPNKYEVNVFEVAEEAPLIVVSKPDSSHVVLNSDVEAPLTIESIIADGTEYCVKVFDVPDFLRVDDPSGELLQDKDLYISTDLKLDEESFKYYTEFRLVRRTPRPDEKYDEYTMIHRARSLSELASKLPRGLYRIVRFTAVDKFTTLPLMPEKSLNDNLFYAYVHAVGIRVRRIDVIKRFPMAFEYTSALAMWDNDKLTYGEHDGSGVSTDQLDLHLFDADFLPGVSLSNKFF